MWIISLIKQHNNEVETRDWNWLYTGEAPKSYVEDGAKPKANDIKAQKLLSSHGFTVFLRKEIDVTGKRTADSFLNGVSWEFKNPEGNSPKAVKNQLKKNVGTNGKEIQSSRVAITNVASSLSFEEMCSQLEALNDTGDFPQVKEVLIVSKDGRMRRYKR